MTVIYYTFANCYSLESVTLSKTDDGPYSNCSALAEIVVPEGNTVFKVGEDGSLYSGGALAVYVENPSGGSVYTVPSHVTDIGAYAFDGRDFETLIIPKTVRTIGDYAFQNCLNLKNVTFEAGTEGLTIGKNAFYKCAALESVKFPARLVSLSEYGVRLYRAYKRRFPRRLQDYPDSFHCVPRMFFAYEYQNSRKRH
ncbi:MAG: leucine-rich repeat domain-containing protein [Christensenellaceae bacterium]